MSRFPAGPKGRFFGLTLATQFRHSPLEFISELGRTYGDIAYWRMGPVRAFMVNSPPLVRELLVTRHKSFCRPPWLARPLAKIDGQGLVLSEGELWRRQRRLLQPAFSTRRFDTYARTTVDYTARMLARWTAGTPFDAADAMTRLTLVIAAQTLYGVELSGKAARVGEAVRVISETFTREASNFVTLPDWLPLPAKRRKRWAIRTLDDMIRTIIRERRASGEDRGDLLSMLLLAVDEEGDGRGMSDEQARDEAMTLFNAAHDSTAAALAWIWYLVASHPEVEDKLVAEVDGVLAGRLPTHQDVERLAYTEMVVKEALRIYPPTWTLFAREAVEDVEIGGYAVPRGSWVYAFPWVTQRDARFWSEPERFDPERFAPGRAESIPPYAWFPFGGGPRVCIGDRLATMQMILITATVLQKFRVRLAAGQGPVEPEPLISIRPKGGLQVSVEKRPEMALAAKS
jgi:cytochrome P450